MPTVPKYEPLTEEQAGQLTEAIRFLIDKVVKDVDALRSAIRNAYQHRIWEAPGYKYEDWAAYAEAELSPAKLKLDPEQRKRVVCLLYEDGLSHRAIAISLGLSKGTVGRDLAGAPNGARGNFPGRTDGTDGKQYAREQVGLEDILRQLGIPSGPATAESLEASGRALKEAVKEATPEPKAGARPTPEPKAGAGPPPEPKVSSPVVTSKEEDQFATETYLLHKYTAHLLKVNDLLLGYAGMADMYHELCTYSPAVAEVAHSHWLDLLRFMVIHTRQLGIIPREHEEDAA
jgi:hypothetical protein